MDQFARDELREGAQEKLHQLDQDALQHNLEGILGRDRNLWRDQVADGAVEQRISHSTDALTKFLALAFESLKGLCNKFVGSLRVGFDVLVRLCQVLGQDTGITNSRIAALSSKWLQFCEI